MLTGARIFVVENEPLIALELSQTLADADGVVVGMSRTLVEALDFAATGEFDVAILDVRLSDGKSFGVASVLSARAIPFLFCTGDTTDLDQSGEWSGVPVVAKPYTPEIIVKEVAALLRRKLAA
jgi:DNA-binding response OmpR family regulator